MTRRRFWIILTAIVLLAGALRGLYPTADPPWRASVGVVWHDEGAWVHNARNKALFGAWRLDEWNPVFIAPVFTALEAASFETFGVGLRQARLVSQIAGVLSVLMLALGARRLWGGRAGLYAGALAATNYVYVMYDRAAIMEGLMAAAIVASWYGSVRSEDQPRWGVVAGAMAAVAFFTKAAAAFYVGSLGLVAAAALFEGYRSGGSAARARATYTLAGLILAFAIAGAMFVLPHWTDYRFYNWQISVTRKPSYDVASILQRVTWFPILHDTFSRSWPELLCGVAGAWSIGARLRRAADAERLLLCWVALGALELIAHDDGNERRYVFLLPALALLTAMVLSRGAIAVATGARRRLLRWVAAPIALYSIYVLAGPLVRLLFLADIRGSAPHPLHLAVRVSAAAAVAFGIVLLAITRGRVRSWTWTPAVAVVFVVAMCVWDVAQFVHYAAGRTYKNYEAMLLIGRALPPGTLVQGKLANGLSLESRIRPIFIGHGFGNFADRLRRDDVRYILTYTVPWLGYEGSQIIDVLDASPGWRPIMTFDVAESAGGHDVAALIEKRARH